MRINRVSPLNPMPVDIPGHGHPGGFGTPRKFDVHTGIDLYCENNADVFAIESGTVAAIVGFTGPTAGSSWWNETDAIIIKSNKDGKYIVYGEVIARCSVGDEVEAGDFIGRVVTVLKKDKGLPMNMLHLEYYDTDFDLDPVVWNLNEPQPKSLLHPGPLLGLYPLIAETPRPYQEIVFGSTPVGIEMLPSSQYYKRKTDTMKTIFGRTAENWYLEQLPEGTHVRFNNSLQHGTGVIRGIASNAQPLCGVTYIIELMSIIDNATDQVVKAEYSHIALSEIFLEVIK